MCQENCKGLDALRIHIKLHETIPQLDENVDNNVKDYNMILPDRFGGFVPASWYLCDQCDFRSTAEDSLKKHNRKKHSGYKPRRWKQRHISTSLFNF